jgi:predicted nucleic acid-binding protein
MLLDTSGLVCCFDRSEVRHEEAVRLFRSARHRLTHSYVLAEFIPVCRSRGLDVQLALEFVQAIIEDPLTEVVWVDKELTEAALNLLRARADKTYSLCDAVSFVLMRAHGVTEALTTDRHFEQEGFTRLLKP